MKTSKLLFLIIAILSINSLFSQVIISENFNSVINTYLYDDAYKEQIKYTEQIYREISSKDVENSFLFENRFS